MTEKQYQAPALQAIARSIVLMPGTENTYVLELGERKKNYPYTALSAYHGLNPWFQLKRNVTT